MLSDCFVVVVVVHTVLDEVVVDLLVQLPDVEVLVALPLFSKVEAVHFRLVDVDSCIFLVDVAFFLVEFPFILLAYCSTPPFRTIRL